MIAELEQEILEALAPLRDVNIVVRGMPNTPREFGIPLSGNGILTLMWERSEAGQPSALSGLGVVQDEILTLRIDVRLKTIRSSDGAYPVLTAIKTLVSGIKPAGATKPIFYERWEFQGEIENQGLWVYQIFFTVHTVFVKIEEDVLPLLKRLDFEDDYGGAQILAPDYEEPIPEENQDENEPN